MHQNTPEIRLFGDESLHSDKMPPEIAYYKAYAPQFRTAKQCDLLKRVVSKNMDNISSLAPFGLMSVLAESSRS